MQEKVALITLQAVSLQRPVARFASKMTAITGFIAKVFKFPVRAFGLTSIYIKEIVITTSGAVVNAWSITIRADFVAKAASVV